MVAFGSLWGGSKKAAPSTIYDDDQVYPLHLLDLTDGAKKFNIVWTYVFHDVLDADKLNTSLRRLLEIGDWRKLGGRIVQKASISRSCSPLRVATSLTRLCCRMGSTRSMPPRSSPPSDRRTP